MSNEKESIGEELFIEELGEVRGGMILVPGKSLTLARGEEGLSPRPPVKYTTMAMGEEGTSVPPRVTTMALGEEGTSVPHEIIPMGNG